MNEPNGAMPKTQNIIERSQGAFICRKPDEHNFAVSFCGSKDLGISNTEPMRWVVCDKKAAIAHNHVQHDRTKPIEIDRHFFNDASDAAKLFLIECLPFFSYPLNARMR